MRLKNLLQLLARARAEIGHSEFVVVGSLSILAMEDVAQIPQDMSMSIDIDTYTLNDPIRIFDLKGLFGENSTYHRDHGFYLDPVSPDLPTLPNGWEARMHKIEQNGMAVWFLHPDDAAVSKLARSDENDLRWVRAGVSARLISPPMVRALFKSTRFFDQEEALRAQSQLEQIVQTFEKWPLSPAYPEQKSRNRLSANSLVGVA